MTISIRSATRIGALAMAMAVAACSHGPKGAAPAAASRATPTQVDAIMALLDRGRTGEARKRIDAALKRDPMNPSVLVLRDSLDREPRDLLGPDSYPYTARAGDTMAGLAQRFLGNRLKSYQLARYNGIARPAALVAGQVLRIPGQPPRIEAPRRVEPRAAPATPTPRAKPGVVRPAAPPTAPPPTAQPSVAARPTANPVAARQARSAGLAALNQGNVVRAVGLLRRAASLAPGDPVIARDLARARRIAATVRARK